MSGKTPTTTVYNETKENRYILREKVYFQQNIDQVLRKPLSDVNKLGKVPSQYGANTTGKKNHISSTDIRDGVRKRLIKEFEEIREVKRVVTTRENNTHNLPHENKSTEKVWSEKKVYNRHVRQVYDCEPAVRSLKEDNILNAEPSNLKKSASKDRLNADEEVNWNIKEDDKIKLLPKRSSKKHDYSQHSEFYAIDAYSAEYTEDVLRYLSTYEWKYTIRSNMMSGYCNYQERAATVNWLLRFQEFRQLPLSSLLKAVTLMDNMLYKKIIPLDSYQLVGLVSLWIISKNDFVSLGRPPSLVRACNDRYTVKDILNMEMKIMKHFDGFLNVPDATDFAAYYTSLLNFENSVFTNVVEYILVCFVLYRHFSIVAPSLQAAAAVNLASLFFQTNGKTWKSLEACVCYYSQLEMKNVQTAMVKQLKKIGTPESEYYPYVMYSTANKLRTSVILAGKINKIRIEE